MGIQIYPLNVANKYNDNSHCKAILTGALAVKLFRNTKAVGAQNSLTESRSISVTGITPNIKFGCGKYIHCSTLRDSRHGPDFLLNSMKKF